MRNEKLDIFRGLAMMWVMFIHCLYTPGLCYVAWYQSFFLIEMPLIFFISGASNGMASNKSLKSFYLTRLQRILIPYWIYAILCIALISIFSPPETIKSFIELVYSWVNPFPDFVNAPPYKFSQNFLSNSCSIALCFFVSSIVLVSISPLAGSFIFSVVMVLAIFRILSTLRLIPLSFKIRSNSLYTLYATKQMQTCASSMRFCVKWNIGRIASVPLVTR